jgi:hypothetical protein
MSEFVLPKESAYIKIDASKIDFNKEIERWNNVLFFHKNVHNELSNAFTGLAKQNLEYLLSLSRPIEAN